MRATTAGRRRRRVLGGWLAAGIVALSVLAVAVTWSTLAGRLAPGGREPGNTRFTSSPAEVAAARTQLAGLRVGPRPGRVGGYSRARFGDAWTDTDRNGCNQRDDVLVRDVLKDRPYRVGRQGTCDHDVLAGTWSDPYSGVLVTLTDAKAQSQEVQIDHIVALDVAWRYGASAWTDAQRLAFANDLRELVAVAGRSNQAKANSDAARWRPERPAQCGYAVRYVAVKAAYGLGTDPAEAGALAAMLDTCG